MTTVWPMVADRGRRAAPAPPGRYGCRGHRSARRRRSVPASSPAPGRSPPAAAGRRTARPGGGPSGRRGRRWASTAAHRFLSILRPASRSGSVTFCQTVSVGSRLNCWKTKPIRSRRKRGHGRLAARRDRLAGDRHGALAGPVEAGRALQQRALARAGRAHDRGERAGRQAQRHAVERGDLVVGGAVDLANGVEAERLAGISRVHADDARDRAGADESDRPPNPGWGQPYRTADVRT